MSGIAKNSVLDTTLETTVSAYFTAYILRKRVEDDIVIVYMKQYSIELVYS